MGRYAQQTAVSVDRSKAELERVLSRYGARQFVSGWDASGHAMVGFAIHNRMVQISLQLPSMDDFTKTPAGRRRRSPADQTRAHEQACRSHWRALCLVVRAKLEAVEAGISTFEHEFLAHIVLPNGATVGTEVLPRIEQAYRTGKMPALLPASCIGGA